MNIKEIATIIRKQLQKEFPQCKFSVRIERFTGGQSLYVHLMTAPFAATTNGETDLQLNHYKLCSENYDDRFNDGVVTERAWNMMRRAVEIVKEYHYDNSDAMIDYFDTNFYMHFQIGKWDKPFIQTGQEASTELEISSDETWTWVKFTNKPSEQVRDMLKALGARWNSDKQAWYISKLINVKVALEVAR